LDSLPASIRVPGNIIARHDHERAGYAIIIHYDRNLSLTIGVFLFNQIELGLMCEETSQSSTTGRHPGQNFLIITIYIVHKNVTIKEFSDSLY
jgi:hypothetical protein